MIPLKRVFSTLSLFIILVVFLNNLFDLNPDNGILVSGQRNFACTPAFCPAFGRCPEFSCRGHSKVVFKNVTQCGCCHRCVEERDEGQECPAQITGNIPSDQCGPHLICTKPDEDSDEKPKCTKIPSTCELERIAIEANPSLALIRKPKPECDEYGKYKGKQCKDGALCHCVDEDGNLIFGTAAEHESNSMNCLCARQFMLVNQKLQEYGSKPLDPIHFMRCKPNGNYLEYQRHNGYDYCVFPQNGTLRDRPVQSQYAKDLSCFKNDRKPFEFQTDCVKKYNEAIVNITKKEKEGISVVGFQVPKCDLDGTYHPVQCFNNKCTCVNEDGVPIKDANGFMSVDRNNPDESFLAMDQQCTCARHLEKIRAIPDSKRNKITDLFRRYQCNKNGNYLPIQCSDSACYCVNAITGYAEDKDNCRGKNCNSHVLKSDPEAIKTLFCYADYNEGAKHQLDKIFRLSHR